MLTAKKLNVYILYIEVEHKEMTFTVICFKLFSIISHAESVSKKRGHRTEKNVVLPLHNIPIFGCQEQDNV